MKYQGEWKEVPVFYLDNQSFNFSEINVVLKSSFCGSLQHRHRVTDLLSSKRLR